MNSIVEDAVELARTERTRTGSAGLLPELQERGVQVQAFLGIRLQAIQACFQMSSRQHLETGDLEDLCRVL